MMVKTVMRTMSSALHAHRARVLLLPVSVGRQATTSVRVPLRACPALPEQAAIPAVRATPHDVAL